MAADLRHTLINLEVPPPPGAWNTIASRLDTEYDAGEIKISEKIVDFEMAPPVAAWENIAAAIVNDPEEVESAPVIILKRPFRTWAAAAAAILVVALSGWYFLNNTAVTEGVVTKVPEATPNSQKAVPEVPVVVPDATAAAAAIDDRPLPRRSRTLVADANPVKVVQTSFSYDEEPTVYDPSVQENIPHSWLQNVRSVNTAGTPNVEAPPIRDANGNIILDKELIFAPDNNYIVVTGPNGEQTRISSKFLPLLSSLNSSPGSLDYFQFFLNENNIWKLRFNEWRDRMIRQADFIPTATNLLDLLELKDFLQEN